MSKCNTAYSFFRRFFKKPISTTASYATAVALAGLSIYLNYALHPITEGNIFFISIAFAIIASVIGGTGPGVLVSILATFGLNHFFLEPLGRFRLESAGSLARIVLLLLTGVLLSLLVGMLRRAFGEVERERQKAEEAIRSRDEFISICSHELNTPLTSLKLKVQVNKREWLRNGVLDSKRYENLMDFTDRAVSRAERLISDMLDLSRDTHGKLTVVKARVDLGTLVQQVYDGFAEQLSAAGYSSECQSTPGISGIWDPHRISQVVANLLSNAIRYGNRHPIAIAVEERDGQGIVTVSDHGPGIAAEDQERIFKRFERLSIMQQPSGMGLGLYIARKIVELHGGTIEVKSRLNEGTTFRVALPRGLPATDQTSAPPR